MGMEMGWEGQRRDLCLSARESHPHCRAAVNTAVYPSTHTHTQKQITTHSDTHKEKHTPTHLTQGALTVTDLLFVLIASGMNTAKIP